MHKLKLFLTIVLVSTAIISSAIAGGDGSEGKAQVIYIKSAKYTLPLLEKWVTEYNRTNPDVQVEWAAKNSENIDLRIVANVDGDNSDDSDGKSITYIGRSALLPVTTKENPLYEQIARKKFGKKELKRLFFADDPFSDEEPSKDKFKEQLTVYSGSGRASGAAFFASHFGQNSADFRGKKIQGDDIYLLQAISKDPTGVTFNNLSYIYDLNNRQLKDNIALLPLDVKKDYLEILKSENLDKTISLLENEKVELVPVLNIGFAYDKQVEVGQFLKWIITEGQKFNHEFGFLQVDEKTLSYQKNILGNNLLTNNK